MVNNRDEKQGGALRSEANRWVDPEVDDGHIRLALVANGKQVKRVVAVAVEEDPHNFTHLIKQGRA